MIKRLKNFLFCQKYKFWKKDKNYKTTWYDLIPEVWRNIFGLQFSNELKCVIERIKKTRYKETHKKVKTSDILEFFSIQVKNGKLFFIALATNEISDILIKYANLSACYCIECGSPARYFNKETEQYLCKKCLSKSMKNFEGTSVQKRKQENLYRLKKKDIPKNNKAGIDFHEKWEIK